MMIPKIYVLLLAFITLINCDSLVDGHVEEVFIAQKDVGDILEQVRHKREAEAPQPASPSAAPSYYYEFSDTSGVTLARLETDGPIVLDLIQNNQGTPKSVGTVNLNVAGTATASNVTVNGTWEVQASLTFKGVKSNDSEITETTIKLTIRAGSPKTDYWSLSKITATVVGSFKGQTLNITDVDLSPKTSYTGREADAACENGYGICAPRWLSWTCSSQSLTPLTISELTAQDISARLIFSGLQLQPGAGKSWGYNWDCDPLIPISLWVTLLISLLMVSILTYGIAMISSVQTPDKYDDPKGPALSIGQGSAE